MEAKQLENRGAVVLLSEEELVYLRELFGNSSPAHLDELVGKERRGRRLPTQDERGYYHTDGGGNLTTHFYRVLNTCMQKDF